MPHQFLVALLFAHTPWFAEQTSRSGTYALSLCRTQCAPSDTSAVVLNGYLVLFSAGVNRDTLGAGFEKAADIAGYYVTPTPNACFHLTRRVENTGMMAGIKPIAFTKWSQAGDTLWVGLYASPDAGSSIELAPVNSVLSGDIRERLSDGGVRRQGVAGRGHAVRIGPPDLRRCATGAAPGDRPERT